jgi:serine/threonine protein kinase
VSNEKNGADLVGKQFGDYVLTSKLATGGMAHIYKGEDVKLQRLAAVKVLTQDMMEADESLTERFQREARAVAALEHDNIVTIYQYGDQDGVYFLAMKFVQGMDLADELNRLRRKGQRMNVARALRILEQVAAALDYAHERGIIHRDIKPSNILLDSNDKAILTDFGLVLRQSVDQTLGTAFGTPRYISPEQAIASEDAVPQSDIYSLAVVLYEILTGQMLFKGATPMEMALSHINEPPPPARAVNPDIPEGVEKELLKALDKEPRRRHRTASEFINAVKAAYGDRAGQAEVKTPDLSEEKTFVLQQDEQRPTAPPIPTPQLREGEEPAPARRRRRFPLLLFSILWLIIVTVGVYLLLNAHSGLGLLAFLTPATPTTSAGIAVTVSTATRITPPPPTNTPPPVATHTTAPTSNSVANNPTSLPASDTPSPTITPQPSETPFPMNTSQPSETPPADSPTIPPVGVNSSGTPTTVKATISIVYNWNVLAIRNEGDFTLDLRDLRLVRGSDDGVSGDDFYGSTIPGVTLRPGECVVIKAQGRITPPKKWNCDNEKVHSQSIRNADQLFWRSEKPVGTSITTYETFEVHQNDQLLSTCATVTRATQGEDSEECAVDWTQIVQGTGG